MHELVTLLNDFVVQLCQLLAIFVIGIGLVKAVIIFVRDALFGARAAAAIIESRMELGHAFSLGLGFLIGGSILKTTIAPSWNDIGQLACIIAIRTVLNYFLMRDVDRDRLRQEIHAGDKEVSPFTGEAADQGNSPSDQTE